jgi:hypothetical protein
VGLKIEMCFGNGNFSRAVRLAEETLHEQHFLQEACRPSAAPLHQSGDLSDIHTANLSFMIITEVVLLFQFSSFFALLDLNSAIGPILCRIPLQGPCSSHLNVLDPQCTNPPVSSPAACNDSLISDSLGMFTIIIYRTS